MPRHEEFADPHNAGLTSDPHGYVDALAGALALDEASWIERLEYRRHLAGCALCVESGAGEVELDRLRQLVARVRDTETWGPDVSLHLARRMAADRRATSTLAFVVGALALVSMCLYAGITSGLAGAIRRLF